jgi:uncharacterized protein
MKVLVSGATGLIGSALVPALRRAQHEPSRLVRRDAWAYAPIPEVPWRPHLPIPAESLAGFDAVVHLAGESIVDRWTADKKQRIRMTRVEGTRSLSEGIAAAGPNGPKALLCASAIGFYGERGDELLCEDSPCGKGFLTDVVREWEEAASLAEKAGIRVVCLRFGVVLSVRGGALAKMLTPFSFGVGGKIGSGRQYMSWITNQDVANAILFLLERPELRGPFNIVAPNPVTNAQFTRALARALHRPAIFTVPAFTARILMGEMADALLLGSQRVVPKRLLDAGFTFKHPELSEALSSMLK